MMHSTAHFLEIDLLRCEMHMVGVPEWKVREKVGRWDYIVCLHRARQNGWYKYCALRLQNRLPRIKLPRTADVGEIVLDLQEVFSNAFEIGTYERAVNYNEPTDPFLIPDDEQWVDAILREKRLRTASREVREKEGMKQRLVTMLELSIPQTEHECQVEVLSAQHL